MVLLSPLTALLLHGRGSAREQAVRVLRTLLSLSKLCQTASEAGVLDAVVRMLQDSSAQQKGCLCSLCQSEVVR